jgi:hypothetical protein
VTHYTAYTPKPFPREIQQTITLLYGGLTWNHERLLQSVFHNLGYRAKPLPQASRADRDVVRSADAGARRDHDGLRGDVSRG